MTHTPSQKPEPVGAFQIALLLLTLVVLAALVADTLFTLPRELSRLIGIIDTAACVVFLTDFFVRLYRADAKLAFLKWGWVDFIASIPSLGFLRWGRLVRVLRLLRLVRAFRSAHKILTLLLEHRVESGLVSVGLTSFLLVAFSSAAILLCEQVPGANIHTTSDALWWSISTLATVGCPDRYPVTLEGRVLGMVLMVAGAGMFGGLSGLAASFFLGNRKPTTDHSQEVLLRLDALQQKLDALGRRDLGRD